MPKFRSAVTVAALSVALSAHAAAQTGLLDLMRTQLAVRGVPTGEVLAVFESDLYRGLAGFVTPATGELTGVRAIVQDFDGMTPGTFVLHLYGEGATNQPTIPANAPPGTTALGSVPVTPPATPGQVAWTLTVSFSNPVPVQTGNDLFVGVEFAGPAPGELFVQGMLGSSLPNVTTAEPTGPGLVQGTTWTLAHNTTTNSLTRFLAFGFGVQLAVEPRFAGASGLGLTQIMPWAEMTASFFAGLHPDTAQPPVHTGRADIPGYQFRANGAVPTGSLVVPVASLNPFVPLNQVPVLPGPAPLWLDAGALVTMGSAVLPASGQVRFLWNLPPNPPVAGLSVFTQALALDPTAFRLAAGAAVRHQF